MIAGECGDMPDMERDIYARREPKDPCEPKYSIFLRGLAVLVLAGSIFYCSFDAIKRYASKPAQQSRTFGRGVQAIVDANLDRIPREEMRKANEAAERGER